MRYPSSEINVSRCNKRNINTLYREAKYLMMKGRIMFVLMGVGSSNPGRAPPLWGPARVQAVK